MADTNDTANPPATFADDPASALVARWLIPSAAVLFGVVGYIVQSAQDALLGVTSGDPEATSYLNSAADFFREAVIELLTWPTTVFTDPPVHRPLLVTFGVIVVILGIVLTRRWSKEDGLMGWLAKCSSNDHFSLLAGLGLILVVMAKFVLMDGPLLKINDVARSYDKSCWALVANASLGVAATPATTNVAPPRVCPEYVAAHGPEKLVWDQAAAIAGDLVCSKVPYTTAALFPMLIAQSPACANPKRLDSSSLMEENRKALAGEFLSNLLLELITVVGAFAVLGRARHHPWATALCMLVIFYGLTAPYAYGKVGMTQLFDYGQVRITKSLTDSYNAEVKGIVTDSGWLSGIILHKDDKGASVLLMRVEACQGQQGAAANGPVAPVSQARATSSFVSAGQLLSIDQISKVDLISWLATQQHACSGI